MNKLPYYQHCVVKISLSDNVKINEVLVDKIAQLLVKGLKLTVVNSSRHEFTNDGLTKFWVLSQSHLVIHSWPELMFVHVDLMTCSQPLTDEGIIKEMLAPIRPSEIVVVKLEY